MNYGVSDLLVCSLYLTMAKKILRSFDPQTHAVLQENLCSQETPTSKTTDLELTKYTLVLGRDSIILINYFTCSVHVENGHISVSSQISDVS